ncbi:dynamin-1-like isoform X2 [Tachypleus tridentatus]|uniref:dynamin-1-like isoform X2 n=1 Tax=Tachypleus tridentatus TaxID=6853 RepID=UPI003FCF309E
MDNEGMQELIYTMNKLQDALSKAGVELAVDLPQIAVLGEQSAGKSSVLENLIGKEFLPRGTGVVTRRPLVIQLFYSPDKVESGIFNHQPNKVFEDFKEIRQEISEETDRETGKTRNVSAKPIILCIYSPNVLQDLTVVDLPGLTKVPVGDQPKDIAVQIQKMVKDFISQPNCLILAVTPATQDIANSVSLQLAREVDPEGERTIGVITKLDLMDEGTDAREILENRIFPLKRGYIGIVSRSQKDIDTNKDINVALQEESMFFKKHPNYKHLVHRMGTKYLQESLNKQLKTHIQERLPSVRSALQHQLIDLKKEYEKLKNIFGDADDAGKVRFMTSIVYDFADEFKKKLVGQTEAAGIRHVDEGAQINDAFYTDVARLLSMDLIPNDQELAVVIKNIHGYRTALFTPELAFDAVTTRLIEKYKAPTMTAVDIITNIMVNLIDNCAQRLKLYPRLRDEVVFRVKTHLQKQQDVAKERLESQIDAEMSFFNVRHPDFNRNGTRSKPSKKTAESEQNMDDTVVIRRRANKENELSYQYKAGVLDMLIRTGMRKIQKQYYCVLSRDSFSWQAKETGLDGVNSVPLTNLKIMPLLGKDNQNLQKIVLFRLDGLCVFQNIRQLEFICSDPITFKEWMEAFKEANVPGTPIDQNAWEAIDSDTDSSSTTLNVQNQENSPKCERRRFPKDTQELNSVETSFFSEKTENSVGLETMTYVTKELTGELVADCAIDTLMSVYTEEAERQEKLGITIEAIETALEVIGQV